MASPIILAGSLTDSVTLTASSAAIAVAEVQNTDVGRPWRSTAATAQTIEADFGAAVAADTIYIGGHNLQADATLRLELSNNSDYSAPELDTTFAPWPATSWPKAAMKRWTADPARYMRLTVTDGAGNTDGYVQIGRLMIGKAWTSATGHDWGAQLTAIGENELQTSPGGSQYSTAFPLRRMLAVGWSWISDEEMVELEALLRDTGTFRDALLSAYPDTNSDWARMHTVLGRLSRWDGFARRQTRTNAIGVSVEQAV